MHTDCSLSLVLCLPRLAPLSTGLRTLLCLKAPAVQAHKGLAAYALGSSLVDSQATAGRFWSVIGTFAMATPLGIGLGMLLSSLATGHMAAGVSALASGTFLYVAFMEIIPRELEDPGHRVAKLGMMVAGFAAMSVLAIWA